MPALSLVLFLCPCSKDVMLYRSTPSALQRQLWVLQTMLVFTAITFGHQCFCCGDIMKEDSECAALRSVFVICQSYISMLACIALL